MAFTILEGSTFCVSDERGDIVEPTMGLFAHDTRFLSRWVLTINGARPLMLSSRKVEYYSAAFFSSSPRKRMSENSVSPTMPGSTVVTRMRPTSSFRNT